MKLQGTSKGWGGARKNAGRRPADISEKEVGKLVSAFKKMAKKTGKTIFDIMAEIAYNEEVDPRVRLKAAEIYGSLVITKSKKSEVTIEDRRSAPVIGLPETMERPKELEAYVQ